MSCHQKSSTNQIIDENQIVAQNYKQDDALLIDTIMEGSHIRMITSASHNTTDVYLHVFHDNLTDSLTLKNYYYDYDFRESLLFMDKQRRIINTWIAKTNNLIIFVLPYFPRANALKFD